MSATHTPGPWHLDAPAMAVRNPAGDTVAIVCFHAADSMAQEDANGRLIAQAPELLRVARLALEELEWLRPFAHTQTLRADLARVIAAAAPVARPADAQRPA
jgi:hypothetical protein